MSKNEAEPDDVQTHRLNAVSISAAARAMVVVRRAKIKPSCRVSLQQPLLDLLHRYM